MDIVIAVLIGIAVGAMVELLLPGHHPSELVLAMLLGVAGALLARFVGEAGGWFSENDPSSYVAALLGAVLLIILYGLAFGRLKRR